MVPNLPMCHWVGMIGGTNELLHEEYQYLKLIKEISENGVSMDDRTGTGTVSVFGTTMHSCPCLLHNSFAQ